MFPFDQAQLPQLTARKALILVDFQNDFLEDSGALQATDPEGFINRAVRLVNEFRGSGDVVWVQSQFDKPVPADTESIIVSDATVMSSGHGSGRGRNTAPVPWANPNEPPDEEAFLSQPEPACVKASSWGAKMSSNVETAVNKGDAVLTKSHYSAFNGTHLLRSLRANMVMEVFICGSMANIGVYATVLDAAGHGMSITVVEDCCGYRKEQRRLAAVKNLIELTGCEIASAEEVVENLQSSSAATTPAAGRSTPKTIPVAASTTASTERRQTANDIVTSLAGLRLNAESPKTVAGEGAATFKAEQADSQNAQPKHQEADGNDKKLGVAANEEPKSGESIHNEDAVAAMRRIDNAFAIPDTNATSPRTTKMTSKESVIEVRSAEDKILQGGLCEGDTDIIGNVLPDDLVQNAFDLLQNEIQWQRMLHQGGEVPRLVAVQGEVADDGSMPVYRHPSDESPPLLPFSPTVSAIKAATERHLGHPLNHVLIQFYRDGKDYISEHSDKTIDVVKGSYIANVSLGAERTMVFRTKRLGKDPSRTEDSPPSGDATKRQVQRAQLPHNSLCRMGLKTNMKWLHSIRQDKRSDREKTPAELAFKGGRISLTFRQIGTFLDADEKLIWGQGATGKTRVAARPVINGQGPEAIDMLKAFGAENNSSVFDWEARYGQGFDVLHISSSPRFFASADTIANMRIWLMLAEHGVSYAKGSIAPSPDAKSASDACIAADTPIRFVDNDIARSIVDGDVAIMLYLDAAYGQPSVQASKANLATRFSRFQRAIKLANLWKHLDKSANLSEALLQELAIWDGYAAEATFIAKSGAPCIADFAVWPVVHAIVENYGAEALEELKNLKKYYGRIASLENTKKVVGRLDDSD
ncbi:hypothetical protein QQS21_002119 [Conoideocrella luteorostrata]|uniref:Fe2OG dioxygenase domain-containing protein n=1 Tax=Conoideocrella luteorostrata TaxID=1105319 RepID=A0AAJ0CWP5_9HYPO|nr:hypothetical protein QQS21_002119 [Conoideocrella luteorostrata]